MANDVSSKRSSLLFVSLACLVAFAVLTGLGVWQTKRLFWKNELIDRIIDRATAEPINLDRALEMANKGEDIRFVRVRVSGTYQHASELHFYTIHESEPGWRVVTPLTASNRTVVLIDRGFVPISGKERTARQDGIPSGTVDIVGTVRVGYAPKGSFTRNNIPERNRWYWLDRPAVLKAANIPEAATFVVQLETPDHAGAWPKALKVSPRLPNNHLSYALTWFGMALGLIIVFVVAIVKNRKARAEP